MKFVQPGPGQVTELVGDDRAVLLGQGDDTRLGGRVQEEGQELRGSGCRKLLDQRFKDGIFRGEISPVFNCRRHSIGQAAALAGGQVQQSARCVAGTSWHSARARLVTVHVTAEPTCLISSTAHSSLHCRFLDLILAAAAGGPNWRGSTERHVGGSEEHEAAQGSRLGPEAQCPEVQDPQPGLCLPRDLTGLVGEDK
jgi:hypothetical protein